MADKKQRRYSSPRQRERRSRVLHAAGRHLERHGLDDLSMGRIAEVSQVSVKTLYNLFGSRDELLLEAASEVLADLGQRKDILEAPEGIPRLLAYVVGTMVDFTRTPTYARAVISTLVKADFAPELADRHMGVVRRFAEASLQVAAERRELRPSVDIERLAMHISADQWGAVLLWEKGLLDTAELPDHVARSHYMTLLPVCAGTRRSKMAAELEALLLRSGVVTAG